jgi:DNA (cytosine-5)-methyltransferase 1
MDISQRTLRHSTSRLLVLPARSRHNGKKVQQMSLGSVVPFVETPYGNLTARDNGGSKRFSVVSMFSGCGGMDLGFHGGFEVFNKIYEALPFNIVWANELNPAACRTYQRNLGHEIICDDVWTAIESLPSKADVVIGGFPCQDISVNGKRAGVAGKRSGLYRAMIEVISRVKPKAFVAENVKGLLMKYNENSLKQVMEDFSGLGYTLSCLPYRAADYGVPQNRERVFIVGVPTTSKTPFIPPSPTRLKDQWMSAREAIADLERTPECESFNHIWSRANKSPEQGNRILLANKPAHTIRAECHGNIQYHYSLPRRISMREAARFQSFPDNFIFQAKLRETERQVGNAVPPVLSWHVAAALRDWLKREASASKRPVHSLRKKQNC